MNFDVARVAVNDFMKKAPIFSSNSVAARQIVLLTSPEALKAASGEWRGAVTSYVDCLATELQMVFSG